MSVVRVPIISNRWARGPDSVVRVPIISHRWVRGPDLKEETFYQEKPAFYPVYEKYDPLLLPSRQ
jgi:hypothetical protein